MMVALTWEFWRKSRWGFLFALTGWWLYGGLMWCLGGIGGGVTTRPEALAAAHASLEDDEHLQRSTGINRSGLVQLRAGFDAMGIEYIPSVANFLCFAVPGDAGDVYTALLHEGIIVRPVASYGLPRHLRVTVGLEDENTRFLEALKKNIPGT